MVSSNYPTKCQRKKASGFPFDDKLPRYAISTDRNPNKYQVIFQNQLFDLRFAALSTIVRSISKWLGLNFLFFSSML